MNYIEYIKLLESDKDRFFDKNENLNDKEKEYYKKFFKDHSSADKQIKNWNFKLSKEDFDKAIYNFDNNFSKLPTETMDDLEEGVDYEYLGDIEEFDYKVHFIYTHKASYTIASNNVG